MMARSKQYSRFLKDIRKEAGYTQKMLSELSTVAPMVISDFENGKTDITVGNLLLIADVLGVTLGDLVKLK